MRERRLIPAPAAVLGWATLVAAASWWPAGEAGT